MKKYEFPGNIRELENMILHTAAQNKNAKIVNEIELPGNSLYKSNGSFNNKNGLLTIEEAIQNHVLRIMQYTNGNVQRAAIILGVSERTLQRRIKKLKESVH